MRIGLLLLGLLLTGCEGTGIRAGCKYNAETKLWDCGVEVHKHPPEGAP